MNAEAKATAQAAVAPTFPKGGVGRLRRAPNTSATRKEHGMRKAIALLATLATLTTASVAGAGIVDQASTTVGNNDTATVTLSAAAELSPTTAFAIGVWSSLEIAAPVTGTYQINCANPTNDRSGSLTLTAGRFVSDAAYLWTGSRAVAGPWFGWDVCSATVTLSQAGNSLQDHSLVAWLNSHNGA